MRSQHLIVVLVLVVLGNCTHAAVNVVGLFRDNMVLQRDRELPVWGCGKAGEKVTVEFQGAAKTTEVDLAGNWMVKIGPYPAGGPYEMRISQNTASLTITNILIGEVWICSGQSNMQWDLNTLKKYSPPDAADEITAAKYPTIRFITVTGTATTRQHVIPCGTLAWRACTPETAGDLSAVAYFFGNALQKKLNVPIGLIVTAQGSSPIRSWISAEAMHANPLFTQTLEDYRTLPERKKLFDAKRAAYDEALAKSKAEGTPPPAWPGFMEGDAYPGPYFYGRVYPLAPFAMRGVIWYQGENDAMQFFIDTEHGYANHARRYKDAFPIMIAEWRSLWGTDFPFLYVQLAPANTPSKNPVMESGWAEVRDAQQKTLKVKNTAMVVTADICESDLHPKKKVEVGKRLALAARALAYGETHEYSGPIFEKAEFGDGKAIISFTHVGSGLMTKGEKLTGFAIAGADKQFYWAAAEIKDGTVVLRAKEVSKPVAVRYAYADFPSGTLFNKEGLPASCFRTDDW